MDTCHPRLQVALSGLRQFLTQCYCFGGTLLIDCSSSYFLVTFQSESFFIYYIKLREDGVKIKKKDVKLRGLISPA